MKKIFVLMALASLTLVSCHKKAWYENDGIPIEPEPEPEIVYEGEGNLEKSGSGGIAETNSTYTWKAEGTTIQIDAFIDTGQYIHGDDQFGGGEYCIGWFTLPIATMNEFLGLDVRSDLNESNFYAVNPDGSKVAEFTSYKPGMWVDANGASSNWSAGSAFWQWYVWEGQGSSYDMSQSTFPGIIYMGCQPANAAAVAGKTVTSKAKIEANGTTYDWIVNFHYAETEAVVEGSGKLNRFVWDDDDTYHVEESLSGYSYVLAADSGLEINVTVNTEEWTDSGDWMIGWFDLPRTLVKEVTGIDPAELDENTFYALDDFGDPVEEMTSYKPGMWIGTDGLASNWSEGVAFWQWYVWGGKTDKKGNTIGYDYDYTKHPDIFVVGGNPGNVSKVTFGEPISTSAMMVGAGKEYPVTITYTFLEQILPETEGYPEAVFEGTGTPYPYGGGVDSEHGDHTIQWYFDEEGLTVDVDAYLPYIKATGVWAFTAAKIPTDVMTAYLGIDDINMLADLSYFYPLNADGTPSGSWTTYTPGEWVDADGNATGWSTGHLYWWYNFGDCKYEGHFTEGLFLVGTNPDNAVAGETVVSKAQLGDKILTVKATFHDGYPTAKTGKVGPFDYSWTMADGAFDVVANVKASQADASWAWMGFFINEAAINAKYGVNLSELATSLENFYPVDAAGNPLDKWTSYVPGMWFMEDGGPGAWNTGVSFWQYYTSNYADLGAHDFTSPGLFYVGKNPGYEFKPGTYVSKAKFAGNDFTFTINIAE